MPVSDGLSALPRSRQPRFPLAFRPIGVCFLDHPVPAATSTHLADCLLPVADRNGVSTFRSIKVRLGRVPPLPRTRWCPYRPAFVQGGHLAHFNAEGLSASSTSRLLAVTLTGHRQRFARAHPSNLPLACGPRTVRDPLGFRSGFTPRRCQQRMRTWGLILDTNQGDNPYSFSPWVAPT